MTFEKKIMNVMKNGQNEALENMKGELENQMAEHYAKAVALAADSNWEEASKELKLNTGLIEQYMAATRKQTGLAFRDQIATKKRAKESVSLWKKMMESWSCRIRANKLDEAVNKKLESY